MKVIAHRGYSGRYPENTMLAFKKAAEAGADEIEMDVQLTKDGTVVITHDESLERVTGVKGWVRDFDFAELRKLDASSVFRGEYGFNPIPSLEEYLVWVKDTAIVTNIELKNSDFYYEGLEEKTIALIQKQGLEGRIIFSSFNHASLLKCKKLCPPIPCGVLVEQHVGGAGYYIKSSGLDFYHPAIRFLSGEVVEDCENHGVAINVWTVNDMDGLLKAEAWGLRGIITNFPDVCKVWLSRKSTGY
ncbi:MAG: glycerophosphodiester phosphodiesterase [Treponema sp.]|jgi:glycerophosphoryl diester phosphodiesterase|nr:glycerophosphodiester phosphodiesterase [Treponema sp.]